MFGACAALWGAQSARGGSDINDFEEPASGPAVQGTSFSPKVGTLIPFPFAHYWYQLGASGTGTEYMYVGKGSAKKLINLDSLASTRYNRCMQYRDSIQACNSYFQKALQRGLLTKLAVLGVGLLLSALMIPASAAATFLMQLVGNAMTVELLVDRVTQYTRAKEYYNIIRNY